MKKVLLVLITSINLSAFAQKNAEVTLTLRDDNVITGISTLSDVTLQTAYGKLSIPLSSISNIETGIGKDKKAYDKATGYLKSLNTDKNEASRKTTYSELIKLGIKAIPAINDFLADPANYPVNPVIQENTYADDMTDADAGPLSDSMYVENEYTPESALDELQAQYSVDQNTPINDVFTIDNEYTMGGTYEFQSMSVKTAYGTLTVPKDKIKSIDIISIPGSGNDLTFKLMAAKYISSNENGGWYKTGIMLKKGERFTITANGVITLASLSNEKYTPDGAYSTTDNASSPSYDGELVYPTYGNVVYRIGESTEGDGRRVGKKLNGAAYASGMLYISIYETAFNYNNKGSYTVKISK